MKRISKNLEWNLFWGLVFLMVYHPAAAKHIIGGVTSYVCNGNGNYDFTMKVYRDCSTSDGAQFDGVNGGLPTSITIYKGNSPVPYATIYPNPPQVTSIEPNVSNPCLIVPPNVCVEEGVYRFSLNLPLSDESYFITYQRCCRNVTITNIDDPGGTGATYTMELTPKAQSVCNNSPVFNNFPPIIICSGEDINFDHSATDVDGDQLVYRFCKPLHGGGLDQSDPGYLSFNGVAPDPDAPPPYQGVHYISPYSEVHPLGATDVAIDPATGLITGVPSITGQFVVGVCVDEYRNGDLLSMTRRDFQFNVANCEPTVVADIAEDSIVHAQEDYFVVNSCGDLEVDLTNESYQQNYIDSYFWEFDLGNGGPERFYDWNPHLSFPQVGTFLGKLVLNPNTNCDDTAYVKVNIYPGLTADFSYTYDTCVAGPVSFTDHSYSDAGPNTLTEWVWDFGDGDTSMMTDPVHIYRIPGNLPVTLQVTDINGCFTDIQKVIRYFPVPQLLVLAPDNFLGCQPAYVYFDNLSFPIDSTYDIVWDFGDGGTDEVVSPTHYYDTSGVFTVTLDVTSPIGCHTDTVFNDLVTILPSPVAQFYYEPEQPSNFEPEVHFIDESIDAAQWKWDFNGVDSSYIPNPVYEFPDTGLQRVRLVVTHLSGCTDTAYALIDVEPQVRFFLPNAFTPNSDGKNDFYAANGVMDGAKDFEMSIWNRYGERIFETNEPFGQWNGRKNNTGRMAPAGIYICTVQYKTPRDELVKLKEYVVLVK